MVDRPATTADGARSEWKAGAEVVIAKWRDDGSPETVEDADGSEDGA
jgi:hypothetical protein